MENVQRRIHIYANGREVLVVPTSSNGGMWTEMLPLQRFKIMPNRDTIGLLATAVDKASRGAGGRSYMRSRPWDGEEGKWQRQNLLFVQITWMPGMIMYAPQRRVPPDPRRDGQWFDAKVEILPVDTQSREIAARFFGELGRRLPM